MQNLSLKIRTLIIAEISGSITPEERKLLDELMEEYPEVRALSASLHKTLDAEKSDIARTGYQHTPAEQIIATKKRSKVIRMTITSAACLLGIYVSFTYFNKKSEPVNDKEVHLLVDDKIIYLKDKGEINADSVLSSGHQQLSDAIATLTIPPAKRFDITLSDGSIVYMNSDSRMKFPVRFTDNKREIWLNGEAYLNVKHSGTPFIVHLPNSDVKVLGTEFNINAYGENTLSIALITGSLKVIGNKDSVQLQPGAEAVLNGNKFSIGSFDETKVTGWITGMVITPDISIDEMATKIVPRYFDKQLIIDKTAEGKHSSFTFDRTRPFKDIMDDYALIHGLQLYKAADGLYHLKE